MRVRYLAVLAALTFWVAAEAFAAWCDHWLTYGQMRQQGIERGIFFLGHPGMWSDLLVLNPLLAAMVARHARQWSVRSAALVGALAVGMSVGMHYQYSFDEFPTALGHHGLPPAGIMHALYMAVALEVVGLFYLASRHRSGGFVVAVSLVLFAHIIVGVYVPLKLCTPSWFPQHGVLDLKTLLPICIGAALLAGLTWWALRDMEDRWISSTM